MLCCVHALVVHVDVLDGWLVDGPTDQPPDRMDLDLDLDLRTVCVFVCMGTVYVMGVGVSLRLCGVVIGCKYVFWCWS